MPASQLIGRHEDIRELSTGLIGGASLIVAGLRRIGKTSVCDAALEICARAGASTAALDLFRIATAAELAEVLVTKTIAYRSALRRLVFQARRAGRLVADTAGMSAVLKSKTQLGGELEIALQPGLAARDPERYLDYALGLPGRIAEADNKAVVVFFDEFQEIAGPHKPYGDPDRLTKRMRAIFQRRSGVSYLFAGSIGHLMRDLFVPRQHALSQFGAFYELRPIDDTEWSRGLRERFATDDCGIDDAALCGRGPGPPG